MTNLQQQIDLEFEKINTNLSGAIYSLIERIEAQNNGSAALVEEAVLSKETLDLYIVRLTQVIMEQLLLALQAALKYLKSNIENLTKNREDAETKL